MKFINDDDVLTRLGMLVMNEKIERLDRIFASGHDINGIFQFTKYISKPIITVALVENKIKVVEWLISKKANLNLKHFPAITFAVCNCSYDVIEMLIANGANVNAIDHCSSNAVSSALANKRYELVPLLIKHGYKIKEDGQSLRSSILSKDIKAIDLLLSLGIDVNMHKPDMVFPYNSTPVTVAATINNFDLVKLLVEHGADITIKDNYGQRPYLCALKNKNMEMAGYLKSIEPESWHNEEQRLMELKNDYLPNELIEFLRNGNRRIDTHDNAFVKYLEFNDIMHIKEVNWKNHRFWDLLNNVDKYGSEGFLVWFPQKKCIAHADYEHGKFKELSKWNEFLADPSKYIDKIFS